MATVYLKAGQTFTLLGGMVTLGEKGSAEDVKVNWTVTMERNVEDEIPNVVGEIVIGPDAWTYTVFLEEGTGRFYYDDENAY